LRLLGVWIEPQLAGLSDAAIFAHEGEAAEQVGPHGQPVEAGLMLVRLPLYQFGRARMELHKAMIALPFPAVQPCGRIIPSFGAVFLRGEPQTQACASPGPQQPRGWRV
jgi:hypothetical protein